jgi:hypothetical protein
MRIYFDDKREKPYDMWDATLVRDYETMIWTLKNFWEDITEISFDHDLGTEKTGYDVIKWIEEKVKLNGWIVNFDMKIHSANPVGRRNMEGGIVSIKQG